MPRFTHPDPKDVTLDALLHALADPARRAIVRTLAADKARAGCGLSCAQAAPPALPKSTLSHHYAVLRAAGLVRAQKEGAAVIHSLRCDEIDQRFPGVLPAILAADEAADRKRRPAQRTS
jgi:DNA-binding transcriptional ArsR family regulator